MKYTDYNSLYLNAQKQAKTQSDGTKAKQVNPSDSLSADVTEQTKLPVEEKQDVPTKEPEPVPLPEPVQTKPPVTEPDVKQEAESPVQSTPFSGVGNNSDDLDSFASEFDKTQEEPVFVEPVAVSMPVTPQREPAYEPDDENDTDDEPAKPAKKEAFTRPVAYDPKKKSDDDDYGESRLRGIPKSLVQRVKNMFSSNPNQGDAVAAYIYIKEGCPADVDVPDKVKELVKFYCGETVSNEDIQSDLMAELNKLKNNNKQLMQKINAVEIAVAYALFDRLSFRKGDISSTSGINFMEKGMHELMTNIETSSINYQTRLKKSEGRTKI